MLQIKDTIEIVKASGAQAVRCYVLCGFHPTVDDEAAHGQHIEGQPRAQGPFMMHSMHLDFTHPKTQSDAACALTALVMVSDRCIENMVKHCSVCPSYGFGCTGVTAIAKPIGNSAFIVLVHVAAAWQCLSDHASTASFVTCL